MSRGRIPFVLASLLFTALIGTAPPAGAAVLPPDFFEDVVATNLGQPTAFAFTPDGRTLITTQAGTVRVISGGSLLPTPALTLGSNVLCHESERGLLGIAVDPQFASNGFVYLYYTFNVGGGTCPFNSSTDPVNRVSRWTMTGNTLGSELVLINNIPSYAGNHNAGDVQFGKDGYLYISVGDGGCNYEGNHPCAGANNAARSRHHLLGKILRIAKDGSIPPSNPYTGVGTARCNGGATVPGTICQETFSWGLRNPFRIAFDQNQPTSTVFHINDVGQNTWEEIDLGQSGADYGWNVCEGFFKTGTTTTDCPLGTATDPIFAYGRSDGCVSITGGAFVPNGIWPTEYDGDYIFSDYGCSKIFRLVPNGSGGFNRVDFATGLGGAGPIHLRFGPFGTGQALYYTTYASGGQLRRIRYSPANQSPTAVLTANPTSGPAPLAVNFDGSGSSDPEGGPLTYQWNFGDNQSTSTGTPTIQHTYNANGTYTASLVVVDNQGAPSPADTVTIQVGGSNTPPSPTITTPAAGALFTVGQRITLTGSATDAQDGTIPGSGLTWSVLRHHADHTHPWFGPTTGNNLSFLGPAPEDLSATTNSYLEVILTATDSGGLSSTVTRNVMPKTVAITFATSPSGLTVTVNGTSVVGPTTITSWQAYVLNVNAPDQGTWKWQSWSDGGARSHAIKTPASPTTYTATFTQGGGCGPRGCV